MDRRHCGPLCGLSFVLLLVLKTISSLHGVLARHESSLYKASRCRVFGVFHVESVQGLHQLSYKEAEAACVSLGVSLASMQQLNNARQNGGFEVCRYGWVKEENAVMARVTKHFKCGRNLIGLMEIGFSKGNTFDAFCFDSNEKRKNSCTEDDETSRTTATTTAATACPTTPETSSPAPPPRSMGDWDNDPSTTAKPEANTQSPQSVTSPSTFTPSLHPKLDVTAFADGATNTMSTSTQGHFGDRGLLTRSNLLQLQSATMSSVTRDTGSVSGDLEASEDASRDDSRSTNVPANVKLTLTTSPNPQRATHTDQKYPTETETWTTSDPHAYTDGGPQLPTSHIGIEAPQTQGWVLLLLIIMIIVIILTGALCTSLWLRRKKRRSPPVESATPLSDLKVRDMETVDGREPEKR